MESLIKKLEARQARVRLKGTVSLLKGSLEPENVADTVAGSAKDYLRRTADGALQSARERPARAAVVGLAGALWLFRRPLARLIFKRSTGDRT